MRAVAAIAGRELAALYRTATGWVVTALYLLLTGVVFALTSVVPGEPASMRYFFGPAAVLLLAVCPAISMRFFSDELRSRTLESLATAPVTDGAIALGKLAGGGAFLLVLLAPTLAFPATLWWMSSPRLELTPVLVGYLGLVLAGWTYLAIGGLISALTESQTLSFLATLIVLLLMLVASALVAQRVPGAVGAALASLSLVARMNDFARGVILTGHLGYFAAIIGFMLVATTVALDARRRL